MGYDRNLVNAMIITNKTHRLLQLLTSRLCLSQCRSKFRRLAHFGIRIRGAKTVKIQSPDMKSSVDQFITPRATVEAVRDGQGRREGPAVNVEDDFRFTLGNDTRRQIAKEQFQAVKRTRNEEMLFHRVESLRWRHKISS